MLILKRIRLSVSLVLLCCLSVFAQQNQSASVIQLENVRKSFELISQKNNYAEDLSSASLNVLPVGIRRVENNIDITIAVDKAIFHLDYTELSVFAKVVLPQNDERKEKVLFFGAREIKLSHDGSIIGDATLALLEDIEIPFNNGNMSIILKGNYNPLTGNSESGTYMSIDCDGFKEFGLDAEVTFPTTLVKKVSDNSATKDNIVRGHFKSVVIGWNDIIANISLPSFEIVGLDGFVFTLQDVVLDFSDIRNDESVSYPAGYEQKYMIPGFKNLWRGIYAKKLDITLPKAFSTIDEKLTGFSAEGLFIDDNGITGLFSANNVLPFEQGNASGWSFSVNSFQLQLEANKLIAAGFSGQIGLPFEGKKTKLDYNALIGENNEYLLKVSPVDSLDFSFLKAKATILPNSYVTLHVVNEQFRPEALLHGSMSIIDTQGDVPVSIPCLEFRSLSLKTIEPYISVEYFGYQGKVSLGAFPISLENISFKSSGKQIQLSSGVAVTLGDNLFTGNTRLSFAASFVEKSGRKYWKFEGIQLDKITIDASIAEIIHLKGTIGWQKKGPIYGDGFFGDMKVNLSKPYALEVNMKGCFGKVDDYRYWFVEGGVVLPVGIPVVGPLSIKGFSGAVAQKMIGTGNRTQSEGSFSSTTYIPDKNTSLALKAAVLFDIKEIAKGEACFDIAFSSKGGLNYIGFYGYAEFTGGKLNFDGLSDKYNAILKKEQQYASNFSTLERLKQFEPNKAAEAISPLPKEIQFGIMGSIGIQYDFKNHSLHAQTELQINSPGGFIQGVGQGGKAGWGVLHIDPSEWYLHLGSPDNRLGIKLNLGNILSIRSGSYLMAGSRIPAMPPPPKEVADILNEDLSKLTLERNIDALSSAKGFAIGSDFQVKTGDLTFLMLYANFMAGLGFDMMMKDYGYLECKGRSGGVGLNGWFAQGQAYTYLQGELGVKVNLWFLKTKFPIIKGGAAALMQAMLPNPSSFKGYLGVQVNVLGLIKGNMRFKLSIGDECEPVMPGSSPLEMAMINDFSPGNEESGISVFTMPQATFNTVIGKAFEAEDETGKNTFRLQLKTFTLTTDKGENIQGSLKWNQSKDAVMFQAKEILPPNTILKSEVQVSFDKLENGTWKTVFSSGQEAVEKRECTFMTGGAPENIPMENIIYSYPVVDQQYFLTKEYNQGSIQLQFGQKYLFEKGFDYKLTFNGSGNQTVPATFKYNQEENRLEYNIPDLKTGEKYTLNLSYTPNPEENREVIQTSKQVLETSDGSLSMVNKVAASGVNQTLQKSILDFGFGTSQYTTFKKKIGAIDTEGKGIAEDASLSFRFLYKVQADEPFDYAEIAGVEKSNGKALIQAFAELKEPFFTDIINPVVYKDYPFGSIHLQNRDESIIGVPPTRSIFVYEPYLDMLNSHQLSKTFYFPFSYEASIVAEQDFRDLQSQVVNHRSMVSTEIYQRFTTVHLPFIKKGKYKTVLKYTLPNGHTTSTHDFYFNNFLLFNE